MRVSALVVICAVCALTMGVGATPSVDFDRPDDSSDASIRSTGDVGSIGAEGNLSGGLANESAVCPAVLDENGTPRHDRTDTPAEARIVELYPNPTTEGNVGEYLAVELAHGTDPANLTVTDGHTSARPAQSEATERVADGDNSSSSETAERNASTVLALTMDPDETERVTDHDVVELDGHLRLAADGDEVTLASPDETLDEVSYDRASTGEIWYRSEPTEGNHTGDGSSRNVGETAPDELRTWWPREATCVPPTEVHPDEATVFVQPDATDPPLDLLANADDRIVLGAYTLTDERVASKLKAAADRDVDVTVLIDGGPVGGTPETTEEIVGKLDSGGVDVRVIGDDGARYRYHHPKYAVVDEAVLVTTENWVPSGIGGASSRGWGVAVEEPALADELASVFEADATGRDTTGWDDHQRTATFVEDDPPGETYPVEHDPDTVDVDSVDVLVAPDNAERELLDLIANAEESILVVQPRIADADFSLVEATIDAAREGVDVTILLDSTWYVEDENDAFVAEIEDIAADEELSITVELVEPDGRFEKIHAKGLIVDDDVTVVGSTNWNENSLRNNREVALVLHGEEPAAYFTAVFEGDLDGSAWTIPIDLLVVLVVAAVASAALGLRRLSTANEGRTVVATGPPVTIERKTSVDPDEPPDSESSTDPSAISLRGECSQRGPRRDRRRPSSRRERR